MLRVKLITEGKRFRQIKHNSSQRRCFSLDSGRASTLNLRSEVGDIMQKAITKSFPTLDDGLVSKMTRIDPSPVAHFQTAAAIGLSRSTGKTTDEVVNSIIQSVDVGENSIIHSILVNPGNPRMEIFLKDEKVAAVVQHMAKLRETSEGDHRLCLKEILQTDQPKKALVDFGSPNMCKQLHVGHLRTIILGDSICRILEFMGHDVERISHVGDFGLPVAMTIRQALDHDMDFTRPGALEDPTRWPTPSHLTQIYAEAKKRAQSDPSFAERSQKTSKSMQKIDSAEEEVRRSWHVLCASSRRGFGKKVFERLNVVSEERGESFYAPLLDGVTQELIDKKLCVESQGAMVVFLHGHKTPVIVRKSDGAYLYATTDLAAIKHRISSGKDWIVYITDDGQKLHFDQVFSVAKLAGWLDETKKVIHIGTGVIKSNFSPSPDVLILTDTEGKKLSSRDGSPYPLEDLLNEAISKVVTKPDLLQERKSQLSQLELSEAIAFNALKYFDLCHSRDYIFSPESMLSFKGNTAVYLMYAYARICSVRRNLTSKGEHIISTSALPVFTEPEEMALSLALSRFPEQMLNLERTLTPQYLCEYLYDVATKFHSFYGACRIVGEPQQESRLQLCVATEAVILTGFHLLGFTTADVI
ncbi:arginyl-tRNA synthetase [Planoprotostelium fungivorum]|uniref:arginine--tRNA ligase n=1 Tax=Planoprotostelium fungivorum TaxID=1890364 RepID=A0A2P6MMR1_9EUKA|nr:arginyl-tRNA synthetase [Planoprotostelium fungivorum]